MKKTIYIIVTMLFLSGCSSGNTSFSSSVMQADSLSEGTITNAVQLDSESTDLSEYQWVGDEVADFQETTVSETLKLIEEKGSGILYFGYAGCPWCERALPQLNQVALKYGITVYYSDPYNGTSQETYNQFMTLFADALSSDEETGEKVFMVPLVVGIKDGEIVASHTALVDDFELNEDQTNQLDDAQSKELQSIYEQIIQKCLD